MLQTSAARLGFTSPEEIPHGIVPFLDLPLVRLEPEARDAFLAHLDSCIDEAFACPPGTRPEPSSFERPDDEDYRRRLREMEREEAALDASCIACRGRCCVQGRGTHAFLSPGSISFVRHQFPELGPEEVRDLYVERLPDRSVDSSCVYHGAVGCTLPRNIRADICNYWQCSGRWELRERLRHTGESRAIAIALAGDHLEHPQAGAPVARLVSVTPGAVVEHDDLEVAALPEQVDP